MSQALPQPTSQPSSPPSSPTSSEAARARRPDIRYASTDHDVVAIHRFLLVVAAPVLIGPVDVVKSLNEVFRVAAQEAAIMAMFDDILVGTMGVIKVDTWYGQTDFLTDRWNFVVPQLRNGAVGAALESEALSIAEHAGLQFINQGKIRRRANGSILMMPTLHAPLHSPPEN